MNIQPIIQSEVSQKEKDKNGITTLIYRNQKGGTDDPKCRAAKQTQTYGTDFWTLWERERVG